MYATTTPDTDTTVEPTVRPAYRGRVLRRMSAEDYVDAAEVNYRRTRDGRWLRRADRAARLAVAR